MTKIKLAKPIKWKDAEPSEAGFIHNYIDVIEERKQWQAAMDKEKRRAERTRAKLTEANRQLDNANETMNAIGDENVRLEDELTECQKENAMREDALIALLGSKDAAKEYERTKAKLKKVIDWNENHKPNYPLTDLLGEAAHIRYTSLKEILGRDAP